MSGYSKGYKPFPMRIQVQPGSEAEYLHYQRCRRYCGAEPARTALAPGAAPSPQDDLIFRGGKTIAQAGFQNIYLGRPADFSAGDVDRIDAAITAAIQDRRLTNVIQQYLDTQPLSWDVVPSVQLDETRPFELNEPDVQSKIIDLFDQGLIHGADHDRTIFNLVLPPGTVLRLDDSSSLRGLGGYHGSVHFFRGGLPRTLYYSANVYSERRFTGTNGIVAFDAPWKNVVGTLYHEMVEFQTDPDVGDAIRTNDLDLIGWNSDFGQEIGDQPISANLLSDVFREIETEKKVTVPVQFMYSNAVHGAEGPIDAPH